MKLPEVPVGVNGAMSGTVMPTKLLRPEEFDTTTLEMLDQLDAAARQGVSDGRPDNTRNGYEQDWAHWARFCHEMNIPRLAVRTGTLVWFVEWLWTQPGWKHGELAAPNTIRRRITGTVVTARDEHNLELPKDVARPARTRLTQLVKQMEVDGEQRGVGQAPALLIPHLVRISEACPDNLMGLRDRAVVTMHFACFAREHELAASRVRDYPRVPKGIQADLRVSKNHPRIVPVEFADDVRICPVRSWDAYAEAAGLNAPEMADTPAFRRLTPRWNTLTDKGLSPEAIGDILTRAGDRANITIRFTGHSPRRGGASEARAAGKDTIVIAKQGGWVPYSKAMGGYFEVDMWKDNAINGVM